MLTNVADLVALIIAMVVSIISLLIIKNKIKKSQLKTAFMRMYICMIIMCMGPILQILFADKLNIKPIYFEYFTYIGNCLLPVAFLFVGIIFSKTKIKSSKKYGLLFIIPIISLLVLWTNDYHKLFFERYSIYSIDTIYGPYASIYSAYTILLFAIGLRYLLVYSAKNSSFFSRQAILIVFSALLPLAVNVLTTLKIWNTTVYITPICFTITILILSFTIFKFKFLSITPVALQKIVDRISDAYLVLNEDNIITDFNKTFLEVFKQKQENVRNKNIFAYLEQYNISTEKYKKAFEKIKKSDETIKFEQKINETNKYFLIEINTISQNGQFLGKLVLIKDITQHKLDMQTIKRNQDMIVERERLASLGQMIGGIAHNLKTPIMSISGATEGIADLIKEYELSIDNPQVNSEDHHAIAKDMTDWVEKIKSYLEYMSDVITAVKGQAVNFSEDEQQTTFTVSELVKHVNILMKHELKNAIVYLNTEVKCNNETSIKGNMNSLVQVINNMISNAIQAYDGKPEQKIDLTAQRQGQNVVISIKDYGPGLPEKVQAKLFKEMITTKGKNGTGLGLYMSYSNIKAHFSGDITVDTEKGKGTTFNIILPVHS